MLKKLGIAAACGIALYGLARLINRHGVIVAKYPDQTADGDTSTSEAAQHNATGEVASQASPRDAASADGAAGAVTPVEVSTDEAPTDSRQAEGTAQVSCP